MDLKDEDREAEIFVHEPAKPPLSLHDEEFEWVTSPVSNLSFVIRIGSLSRRC